MRRISPLASPLTSFPARAWSLAKRTALGLYEHHAFDHAATMAFYFFLGVIPVFVFVGSIVGQLVHDQGVETLARPLYGVMPPAAAALLVQELRAMEGASATALAPLSLVGFVILMSNGVHNLMDVFEMVTHAPHRTWVRQRILALAWVAATVIGLSLTAWLIIGADHAASSGGADESQGLRAVFWHVRHLLAGTWRALGVVSALLAVASVGLAAFYRVSVAHPPNIRRRVWPGTLAAMIAWMLVSWAFAAYVRTLGHYALYFGSLATVAVLLFWLYLTSLAFLLGAELNAQLEGVRDRAPPESG